MILRTGTKSRRAGGLRLFVFACTLVAAGCASNVSPTIGTISQAGLSGVWRLDLLQVWGLGAERTPAGATYTLTFSDDRVSARADCNVCNAAFTLQGDSLQVSSLLACTRALCPTQAFEARYTRILDGDSRVEVSGATMSLISARGLLRFTR
jgi:heat shock protein HslJ